MSSFTSRFTAPIDDFTRQGKAFLDDPLHTPLPLLDSGNRIPVTRTRTSYTLTLHARVFRNGIYKSGVIGAIHEMSSTQTRQVDEEYEVDLLSDGRPRELIPQNLTGRTLNLKRYDLYSATMEDVFGTPEIYVLSEQTTPLTLRMTWRNAEASVPTAVISRTSPTRVYEFLDCYITNFGRTASTRDVIVGADATLVWRKLVRLQ